MKTFINSEFNHSDLRYALNESRKKILIVEDDEIMIRLFDSIFTNTGYCFRLYREVKNILPLIDTFKPDVVLLDYTLPVLSGEVLCNQIKKYEPTASIPVIILSASSNMFLSISKYGCDSFIGKPFKPKDLLDEMNKYCQVSML